MRYVVIGASAAGIKPHLSEGGGKIHRTSRNSGSYLGDGWRCGIRLCGYTSGRAGMLGVLLHIQRIRCYAS